MCEGSFLPSSFGPHQKHTEFESSLRSYLIKLIMRISTLQGAPSKLCLGGDFLRGGWPAFAPWFLAKVGSRGLMQRRASFSSSPVTNEPKKLRRQSGRIHGSLAT